ncbi:universal stress protein UspA [Priestia megaterium]|uniref:Universal stress protein n=2 Tax=Priestia megaterium TaxID=1404 RepID=A0A3D8WZL2_PRIMG|nr:universal stress protein UspA [Priestia megaterium]
MMNMAYRNILVAVDGSVEAEWAFKKAVNSAKKNNAHLILCHVIDIQALSPSPYAFYTDTRFQDAEKFAEELLTNYMNLAIKAGVTKVETLIEHGSPKTKISKKIAPEKHVDLIVCGATGLNAVERILIGSVSQHILRYAKCDVLIVRTPKEAEEESKPLQVELTE